MNLVLLDLVLLDPIELDSCDYLFFYDMPPFPLLLLLDLLLDGLNKQPDADWVVDLVRV